MDSNESDLNRALIDRDLHGCPVPQHLMRSTGMDLFVLRNACDKLFPHLGDMRGYKPLTDYFKTGPSQHWIGEASSHGMCNEVIELGQFNICTTTLRASRSIHHSVCEVDVGKKARTHALIRVFLRKDGQWIVWTNSPTCKFIFSAKIHDVVESAYALLPVDCYLGLAGWREVESLALYLARSLYRLQVESSNAREQELVRERRAQDKIRASLEKYMCP